MNCEQTLGRLKPVPKISLLRCLVLNVENKAMPSEKKKVSDGICAPCVRLRFVLTKLIVPTLGLNAGNKIMRPSEKEVSDGLCVSCVRLRFVLQS